MRNMKMTAGRGPRSVEHPLRMNRPRNWLPGMLASLALAAPSQAWAAQFKQAPGAPDEADGGGDMILGLVHANTLFFIALGVFCVFWFLLGGGRKAKIGRKGH